MQFSPKTVSVGLALGIVLLSFAPLASAPWRRRSRQGVAALSEHAVLRGTLSPSVRADRGALRDYFVTAFKVLPGLKVAFGDQLIRVYGGTAVNTGYYTFSR
jgi:hypothetical protein